MMKTIIMYFHKMYGFIHMLHARKHLSKYSKQIVYWE